MNSRVTEILPQFPHNVTVEQVIDVHVLDEGEENSRLPHLLFMMTANFQLQE